jgi:hypothetical protein
MMSDHEDNPRPTDSNVRHWARLPGGCFITVDDGEGGTLIGALTRHRKEGLELFIMGSDWTQFDHMGYASTIQDGSDLFDEVVTRIREDARKRAEPDHNVYVRRQGYGWRVHRWESGKVGHKSELLLTTFDRDEAIARARDLAPDSHSVVVDDGDEW